MHIFNIFFSLFKVRSSERGCGWCWTETKMAISGCWHPFLGRYKVAFTKEGKVEEADVNLFNNAGWNMDLSFSVMEWAMFHLDNGYKVPHVCQELLNYTIEKCWSECHLPAGYEDLKAGCCWPLAGLRWGKGCTRRWSRWPPTPSASPTTWRPPQTRCPTPRPLRLTQPSPAPRTQPAHGGRGGQIRRTRRWKYCASDNLNVIVPTLISEKELLYSLKMKMPSSCNPTGPNQVVLRNGDGTWDGKSFIKIDCKFLFWHKLIIEQHFSSNPQMPCHLI